MTTRFYQRLLNHPYLIILFSTILIVALAAGAQNLYFRGDYKTFFREELNCAS